MTQRCADLIDAEVASTGEVFERYMNDPKLYDEGDDDLPPFFEYGLSFEYREEPRCYEYLLSWGGPSDMVRFFPCGKIEYRYHDWFDGAGRIVTKEPWAQWLHEFFEDIGSFDWPEEEYND